MNLHRSMSRFQTSIYTQSIRHGLTLAIPFLIMGSFSLLFKSFPIESYQDFIQSWLNGTAAELLTILYESSLGSLALVLTITISISYGQLAESDQFLLYPLVSICAYLAFCGGIQNHKDYIFNAEWVFTATCITLLSCILFQKTLHLGKRFEKLHTTGADYLFNASIKSLFPVLAITLFFTVVGYLLRMVWGNNNITNFGSYLFMKLFEHIGRNIFGVLLYVVITHTLWFMGIHGTNTLEAVSRRLFEQSVEINHSLVLAGNAPTEIFSKTFLDTFVFLGGCGTALSFVLALLLVSRKSHNRKISLVALPSALFNISEIAVFGFPIIFNFTMAIPFILTPVILTLTSALVIKTGLVPPVTQSVEWTVPVLLSGYKATGSISGSILQLANLILGIFIYIPFVRSSERSETLLFMQAARQLELHMTEGERTGSLPKYLDRKYPYYYYAKTFSMDLYNSMRRGQIQLFYQAQISSQGTLHGMEALMRWNHPAVGFIAPPVLIGLAYEGGFLKELSYYLLNRACTDAQVIGEHVDDDTYLSVNISPKEMTSGDFFQNALEIIEHYQLKHIHPVLEITERAAMEISDSAKHEMERLKAHGIGFSLDDFGMGHNSLLHLQDGSFDEVKLDGNLVTQLLLNQRSREIAAGIIQMSQKLNCRIVAEFVETVQQQELLQKMGCHIYQGYYYSRPLPLDEFLNYIEQLPAE